ncbi:MAG: hypothetical protein R2838_25950 [Caldilineaceae bacterium]
MRRSALARHAGRPGQMGASTNCGWASPPRAKPTARNAASGYPSALDGEYYADLTFQADS